MGYDISKITLNVSLGDTSKTVSDMKALIKTLESKKVKLEVDSSSLRASLSVMSSEIEKMYKQELEAKKKSENEKVSYTKQKSAEAIAYLKQQQSEIEKMYGVSSKLSFNQNPNTGQITSAIISYTTELGKAEKISYSLKEAITGVTTEGKKLGEIKLAPTNQNFTNDIVKVNTELQKAQESLDKFKATMATNIANISVGKNGDMANQLQVFEQLKTKFAELQNMQLNTSNLSEYKSKINEVNELYSQTKTKITEVNTTQAQMNSSFKLDSDMTNKIKDLNQQLDIMLSKNPLLANNNLFSQVRQDVEKLGNISNLTQFNNQIKDIQRNIKTLNATTTSSVGVFTKLGQSIKSAFSFMSVSMVFYKIATQIREMPESVRKLDTALVDLKKTTSMNTEELNEFYKSSNEMAKSLGVTTEEIINQASAWSRLGYATKEQAETMAKVSAIFKSISPNMTMDEATDGLVSAMKAFDISAEDALDGIASKINVIGNTQAVNNEDIVEFLTRSSSAMAEANNTLDETIALGTAAVEITRDAASVGNVLKTEFVFMYRNMHIEHI